MNFYFQSGEFILAGGESWLGLAVQFLAILVGALMSIAVFELGKGYDRKKEIARIANLYNYLKNAIESLVEPIDKQTKSLNVFYKELDTRRDKDYTPETFVTLHTKGIRWINHQDLYHIFVKTNNSKQIVDVEFELFRKLNADLDLIDSVYESLKETFGVLLAKRDEYIGRYNANIKAISDLKDKIYLENKELNRPDYPFYNKLDELMAKWSKLPDYMELDVAKDKFIVPLMEICREADYDSNSRQALLFCTE